ncbi:MAG: isoprenylcysteine carboxylmethyltransferase family protein [Pseudomonadota bacterium]
MIGLPQVIVLLVALQRLGELVLSRRNERRLLAAGGQEHGARHYPLFVVLHASWLLWLFFAVPNDAPVNWWLLGLFGLLQLGRIWVIASLGPYWTARVVTLADRPLIRRGPYRFFRHPNYLIVIGEIAVLPLAFGAWQIALGFSLANAALLAWRIRVEEAALAPRREATWNDFQSMS